MFQAISAYGITSRAVKQGLLKLEFWNPRDFALDKHRTVDDRPYGGGPGMVMNAPTVVAALKAAKEKAHGAKTIYLSPQGKRLNHQSIAELAKAKELIFLAGRYEGVDERAIELCVDEEWSLGDYVLTGGELPTMVLIDALTRLLPGALGDSASNVEESFVAGLLDCQHFTRPEIFEGRQVPEVLLSGDHAEIAAWRHKQQLGRTWQRRPDLLEKLKLTEKERAMLQEYLEENGLIEEKV